MKVLFAVNNEKVSESIMKKYQARYKEIISAKNVYYFNAIIKELQKDKSYGRVVISEDLEPYSNKNYEMILTGINNGFSNNLEYFYGESNIAKYNNDEVKEIINEVKNITDVNKLTEKYKRLFEIVQDDVPYISLYRNKNILILNQKVGGEISPTNYSLFYKFWTWYKQE